MNRAGMVLVFVALVAGGVFGYVVGTTSGGEGGAVLPREGTESGAVRPERPPPETFEPTREPDRPGGSGSELGRALRRISVPRAERGAGIVTGSVKTETGEPLAGAVVRLYVARSGKKKNRPRNRYKRAQGPPEDPDLEEFVKQRVEQHLKQLAGRLEARTGADGNFTVTGVMEDDTTYHPYAYARGYECRMNPPVRNLRAGMEVHFLGKPVYDIRATVYLVDGSPAEEATISRYQGNRGLGSANWYADDPIVQLEPGTFDLQATGGEHGEFRSEKVTVTIPEKGPFPEVELHLRDEPGVRGELTFPDGEQNASVRVVLRKLEGNVPDEEEFLRRGGQTRWVYPSSAEYLFRDITPGTYLLGIRYNDNAVVGLSRVEVGNSMVEKNLEVPPPDPSQYVLVTVEGPDGRPVSDVSFGTGYRSDSYSASGGSRSQRLPDGRYRVFHYAVEEERKKEGGVYTITVRSRSYGEKTVEYTPESTPALTVSFEEPAFLEVTVLGYKGSGMEGKVTLTLEEVKEGKLGPRRHYWYGGSRVDGEGRQKFGPTPPGEYEVVMSVRTTRGRTMPGGTVTVLLKPGRNTASIELPKLYTLTVTTDADGGVSFQLQMKDHSRGYWYSDHQNAKDGRVVFEGLPAGVYVLSAWGGVTGRMEISVPARTNVRFTPTVPNALLVHVRSETGTLVAAGLAEGDLVIGIDGEEFRNQRQMGALITLANEKGKARLTVLRGSRRFTVDVAVKNLWNGSETGVKFEYSSR